MHHFRHLGLSKDRNSFKDSSSTLAKPHVVQSSALLVHLPKNKKCDTQACLRGCLYYIHTTIQACFSAYSAM
jgi:hypothetical protein